MTEGMSVPKIATVMPSSLFGGFSGSPTRRAELLAEAADHADFVDIGVEIGPGVGDVIRTVALKTKVILSWHSDEIISPEQSKKFVAGLPGCDVYKIVMPAREAGDNLRAFEVSLALEGTRRVVFCYGDSGKASRLLAPIFGSEWVYGALRRGQETAPGQVDVETLKRVREALL